MNAGVMNGVVSKDFQLCLAIMNLRLCTKCQVVLIT